MSSKSNRGSVSDDSGYQKIRHEQQTQSNLDYCGLTRKVLLKCGEMRTIDNHFLQKKEGKGSWSKNENFESVRYG